MRPCSNCERAGAPSGCKIGASSDKYTEYLRKNSSSCSLVPFSPAKWDRIRRHRLQKQRELRDTFAKITRLQSEVAVLEEKELNIVNDEVTNIEELERDEALTPLSDFPFDITSEQVKFPSNLD